MMMPTYEPIEWFSDIFTWALFVNWTERLLVVRVCGWTWRWFR